MGGQNQTPREAAEAPSLISVEVLGCGGGDAEKEEEEKEG
jgi:hypothetical protein